MESGGTVVVHGEWDRAVEMDGVLSAQWWLEFGISITEPVKAVNAVARNSI